MKNKYLTGNRERAGTQIALKHKMSKNLIVEDDEELVDETEIVASGDKKNAAKDESDDEYSDDDDFDWVIKLLTLG